MPRQIDPAAGVIVTANSRVVARHDEHLCTDCHPPHRARGIWRRLADLPQATVTDMEAVLTDMLSLPARDLVARLASLELKDHAARLRDRLLAWDCRIAVDSPLASVYVSLRLALTRAVAHRSGLAALDVLRQRTVAPGLSVEYQLSWCLPQLLRADDRGLLGGASWEEALAQAVTTVASEPEAAWGERHHLVLRHSLGALFPHEPLVVPRDQGPVSGDNETVFTTGFIPHVAGTHAAYASLARYVFDVGIWEASRWGVFHGSAGDPRDPHYDSQSTLWRQGDTVPMHYDWAAVRDGAQAHTLLQPA